MSSWSLIIRASKTSFATKLHKAAIACNEGPTGGQCLQAAPHAEPDLTRGSRVLGRGKSRSISKSIRLPRRYPSLAKLPETDKEMITFQVRKPPAFVEKLPNLKTEANARKGRISNDVDWSEM